MERTWVLDELANLETSLLLDFLLCEIIHFPYCFSHFEFFEFFFSCFVLLQLKTCGYCTFSLNCHKKSMPGVIVSVLHIRK